MFNLRPIPRFGNHINAACMVKNLKFESPGTYRMTKYNYSAKEYENIMTYDILL